MPETEALLPRFRAANTQVLGVSIDSVHCHTNWAASLGGISLPLLADFHPKGAVAESFGLYLDGAGITDRATVIIDASGVIRFLEAVGPGGRRNIAELAAACEKVNAEYQGEATPPAAPQTFPAGATLYVKSGCGFSLRALNARANLRLDNAIAVKNVTENAAAKAEVLAAGGQDQAPCLVIGGKAIYESDDIIATMVKGVDG